MMIMLNGISVGFSAGLVGGALFISTIIYWLARRISKRAAATGTLELPEYGLRYKGRGIAALCLPNMGTLH